MTSRKTFVTYGSYCAIIFALTFFGPYHGWIYGLVFSVGATLSMWLVMTFAAPAPEQQEAGSTKSAEHQGKP
jgi:hypothetical protein